METTTRQTVTRENNLSWRLQGHIHTYVMNYIKSNRVNEHVENKCHMVVCYHAQFG
jgi:hypothetical protein